MRDNLEFKPVQTWYKAAKTEYGLATNNFKKDKWNLNNFIWYKMNNNDADTVPYNDIVAKPLGFKWQKRMNLIDYK